MFWFKSASGFPNYNHHLSIKQLFNSRVLLDKLLWMWNLKLRSHLTWFEHQFQCTFLDGAACPELKKIGSLAKKTSCTNQSGIQFLHVMCWWHDQGEEFQTNMGEKLIILLLDFVIFFLFVRRQQKKFLQFDSYYFFPWTHAGQQIVIVTRSQRGGRTAVSGSHSVDGEPH